MTPSQLLSLEPPKPVPLPDAQISATIFGLNGSPLMIGDDVDRMAPERLALLRQQPVSPALHALGVGASGGLVLAMMTRTARGHTGRPLQAGRTEVWAYGLILLAAAPCTAIRIGSTWPTCSTASSARGAPTGWYRSATATA